MKTLSNRERGGSRRSSNASQDLEKLPRFSVSEILESLKVHADNLVSSTQTVFHIECPDRKGLMYDLFRITKDIGLQISYCKVTLDMNVCKADLFVHEEERQQKLTDEMIEFFCAEIKRDLELVEKELYARLVGSGSDTSVRSTEFKKLANLLDYGVL